MFLNELGIFKIKVVNLQKNKPVRVLVHFLIKFNNQPTAVGIWEDSSSGENAERPTLNDRTKGKAVRWEFLSVAHLWWFESTFPTNK